MQAAIWSISLVCLPDSCRGFCLTRLGLPTPTKPEMDVKQAQLGMDASDASPRGRLDLYDSRSKESFPGAAPSLTVTGSVRPAAA